MPTLCGCGGRKHPRLDGPARCGRRHVLGWPNHSCDQRLPHDGAYLFKEHSNLSAGVSPPSRRATRPMPGWHILQLSPSMPALWRDGFARSMDSSVTGLIGVNAADARPITRRAHPGYRLRVVGITRARGRWRSRNGRTRPVQDCPPSVGGRARTCSWSLRWPLGLWRSTAGGRVRACGCHPWNFGDAARRPRHLWSSRPPRRSTGEVHRRAALRQPERRQEQRLLRRGHPG